ncbi:MAG: hypothetical protein FWC61_00530 [Proteobacteria bacterium]|nr:hypothetical protein [Pseudomonadota bacterium]
MEHIIRTFGRIHGKKLSARQAALVENLLPELTPTLAAGVGARGCGPGGGLNESNNRNDLDNPTNEPTPRSVRESTTAAPAARAGANILEIGFGAGEHLLHLAAANPDATIIGAEPFMNGVASLLSRMTDSAGANNYSPLQSFNQKKNYEIKPEYKNIRIWPDDARKLLNSAVGADIICPNTRADNIRPYNKIYILHPDPWPKARHEKRRLLSAEFLNALADHLTPRGQIIIGTDHADYFEWVSNNVKNANCKLKILNTDFLQPPESGLDTRYMRKNKFGSAAPMYLVLANADN